VYCRYCGDEISASRLLTDTAFCCDAHRHAHRERRGAGADRKKTQSVPGPTVTPVLSAPKPKEAIGNKPRRKIRYIEKTPSKEQPGEARVSAGLPAPLKPIAMAPAPPANEITLAPAAAERWLKPVAHGRMELVDAARETLLPAFPLALNIRGRVARKKPSVAARFRLRFRWSGW